MLRTQTTGHRPQTTDGTLQARVLLLSVVCCLWSPTGLPGALASTSDMAVQVSNTPNPNALKFTVGVDVGGPATFVAGGDIDDPTAAALVAIDGVTSVFMTADFVTLSKTPATSWDVIAPLATTLLEQRFGT